MLGLGTNSLGIGLVIQLRDRFTQNANTVMQSMNRLHKNAEAIMRSNLTTLRQVGFGMTMAGGLGIAAMGSWVKEGAKFRYTMDAVGAVTHATKEEMRLMSEKAMDMGRKTVFTIQEIADSMKFLGMAGFSPKDIVGTIDAVTALGAATDTAIGGKGGAADMMTNMMTAFGMAADQSMRAANIMSKATVSANLTVTDLHEALKYAASDFTTLGLSFEEASAAIMMLGNAGIHGSMAGTALGNMLRKLSIAMTEFGTKRQVKGLEQFGITASDVVDKFGNMKSLVQVIDTLFNKIGGGNVKALAAIQAITGIRGARGLIPLIREIRMGKSFGEYAKMLKEVDKNEALRIAADRMNNLTGDTFLLTSAWSAFKAKFSEALDPLLRFGTQVLKKIVDYMTAIASTRVGKAFIILGATLVALIPIAGAFLVILSTIGLMMVNSKIGYTAMVNAGRWAWNALIARALTYLGVLRGIKATEGINKAGSLFDKLTGRIIVPASKMQGGGIVGNLLRYITSLVPAFGRLVPTVLRLVPIIGWVVAGMTALYAMGFKLKDVWWALKGTIITLVGTIANVIMWIIDALTLDWNGINDRFSQRQSHIMNSAFNTDDEQKARFSKMNSYSRNAGSEAYSYLQGRGEKAFMSRLIPNGNNVGPTTVNIHVDGKKTIEHVVKTGQENDVYTKLGFN